MEKGEDGKRVLKGGSCTAMKLIDMLIDDSGRTVPNSDTDGGTAEYSSRIGDEHLTATPKKATFAFFDPFLTTV